MLSSDKLELIMPELMNALRKRYPEETRSLEETWNNIETIFLENIRTRRKLEKEKIQSYYRRKAD